MCSLFSNYRSKYTLPDLPFQRFTLSSSLALFLTIMVRCRYLCLASWTFSSKSLFHPLTHSPSSTSLSHSSELHLTIFIPHSPVRKSRRSRSLALLTNAGKASQSQRSSTQPQTLTSKAKRAASSIPNSGVTSDCSAERGTFSSFIDTLPHCIPYQSTPSRFPSLRLVSRSSG